jgi:hypothetical protein
MLVEIDLGFTFIFMARINMLVVIGLGSGFHSVFKTLANPECCCVALHAPRVVIQGSAGHSRLMTETDLVCQLGIVTKVEHSTSGVEVHVPKLGMFLIMVQSAHTLT